MKRFHYAIKRGKFDAVELHRFPTAHARNEFVYYGARPCIPLAEHPRLIYASHARIQAATRAVRAGKLPAIFAFQDH